MPTYRIEKVLNNNVAVALDERQERVILTGNGLGFRHRRGDVLPSEEVGRVYVDQGSASANRRLEALFSEIPFPCVEVSEKIADFAAAALGRTLSQNLVASLADHISFAIAQKRAGTYQPNLLSREIEDLYPSEYLVGRQALVLIERDLGERLDPSEAGSIAFHVINNSEAGNVSVDATRIIAGVEGMLGIIQRELGCELPQDSSRYARLVTHLKFLMRRVLTDDRSEDGAGPLMLNMDEESIRGLSHCLDAVAGFLAERFDYELSNAERLYLFVHIVSIVQAG